MIWAYQTLTAKNSLTAADAGRVEEAFPNKTNDLGWQRRRYCRRILLAV